MSKPKVKVPKKVKAGEVFEIKTMIKHDMETGNRKGKDGKPIPRKIINKFVCSFKGSSDPNAAEIEVMSADLHPALSANPYISFFATAPESGRFHFLWVEDGGAEFKDSQVITVE